jgi:outer membrane protein assembly factor BamD (BamD/ComL family)
MRPLSTLLVIVLTATGCTQRPLFLQPRPVREWPAALQAVKEAARAGNYAQADSTLAQFESRYATSYEGREAAYWRALLLADPANPHSSPAEALRAINRYFAGGSTAEAYDEATVLRRIVQRVDSLTRELDQARRLIADAQEALADRPVTVVAVPTPAVPAETREPRAPARENRNLAEEVRRLRDELSKANQELERVRKRLSEQRP